MPQILVVTDATDKDTGNVLLSERLAPALLESDHYAAQLVERVRWALADAERIDRADDED
jgi:hypothetical protein